MGNSFGQILRVTTWGESHGDSMGAVLEGLPAGLPLCAEDIQKDLDRRRPGQDQHNSSRQEKDRVRIVSGLFQGQTLGTPLTLEIDNSDARPQDYQKLEHTFRPGHADLAWQTKYGRRDHRGGGRSGGRETVSRVAAGAVARVLLAQLHVEVLAATLQIGAEKADFPTDFSLADRNSSALGCPDLQASERMRQALEQTRRAGDSLGGMALVTARGVPAGWGEPVFDKLKALLAQAVLSIPSAVSFMLGPHDLWEWQGSQANDTYLPGSSAQTGARLAHNYCGGIQGGISVGSDIIFRAGFKPIPSIALPQNTVDDRGQPHTISVGGRHDVCVLPRALPVLEAMTCLVLADAWLMSQNDRLAFLRHC